MSSCQTGDSIDQIDICFFFTECTHDETTYRDHTVYKINIIIIVKTNILLTLQIFFLVNVYRIIYNYNHHCYTFNY